MLTKEKTDEFELFERLKSGDKSARNEIIERNMGLVVSTALKFSKTYMVELEDLIQEGVIGLIIAIEKFDYTKGFKFSTFAVPYIKQKIQRYIWKQSKTVHVSAKDYLKLNKIYSLEQKYGDISVEDIAAKMGLKEDKAAELLTLKAPIISLNQSFVEDGVDLIDVIPDEQSESEISKEHEMKELKEKLEESFRILTEAERKVLKLRYGLEGPAMTQREIAENLKVSKQRIWQLEKTALRKLQRNRHVRKMLQDFLYEN
ncbi:hypothetical protein O163_10135 [Caldanaerobacter subterraneus subsp. yonseiensis KB-1]|uniref:RNA polymerase sigma factor n=1 Tax=Caldanaerobacter subterraneus subsp. yonseiensis KB-1 TaxID=1388761 RepID=U5CTS9_CALSX|nr:sigma-70 family RNA polymerase sigma factor [Caldanaerobacter subterraneus]ERM91522.1 hypothetical protein O163_10135 [Caldanaerobacter subterraneus subsp. yonseiensis KB-1]